MHDINTAAGVRNLSLRELRQGGREALRELDEDGQDKFHAEQLHAMRRSDANKIHLLLEEFESPLCGHVTKLVYEIAFIHNWIETAREIYQTRWWINEYSAGVYFIYDPDDKLQYVGSCCGGQLGNRIGQEKHNPYRDAVDVVLFDRGWCHLTLALEALVISRLKPPKNKTHKNLWIKPATPFDEVWPLQATGSDDGGAIS